MYRILNDRPNCPYCREDLNEGIHHCMIWVNGLPTPGDNHMKYYPDEIKEAEWGYHLSCVKPLELCSYYNCLNERLDKSELCLEHNNLRIESAEIANEMYRNINQKNNHINLLKRIYLKH